MNQYGLIGFPLGHSFSKKYFEEKFLKEAIQDVAFDLFPIPSIDAFPALMKNYPDLKGLAVTVPYKKQIISYLDELDSTTLNIGAVNCIKIQNGKTKGFNTDVIGFEKMLPPDFDKQYKQAMVFGSGGASACVQYVLNKLGVAYKLVSRNPEQLNHDDVCHYDAISKSNVSDYTLLINTTPLGMAPAIDTFPDIPYEGITEKHLLIDLVYNPAETLFLKKGREFGANTLNGYPMFTEQAEENSRIWNS